MKEIKIPVYTYFGNERTFEGPQRNNAIIFVRAPKMR
jgi:hypothetical protein